MGQWILNVFDMPWDHGPGLGFDSPGNSQAQPRPRETKQICRYLTCPRARAWRYNGGNHSVWMGPFVGVQIILTIVE